MSEPVNKIIKNLNISSPHAKKLRWVHTSGNEDVLIALCDFSSEMMQSEGVEKLQPKIILIEGASGSGVSSLLSQAQSMLKQRGHKLISLMQGTDSDERYILSNLVEELRTPYTRWSVHSDYLSPVHERVLGLRQYDFIIVDDFQRFLVFTKRISSSNLKCLSYLSQLSSKCRLIIGGDPCSITAVAGYLQGCGPLIYKLRPMMFDEGYINFVRDVRSHLNQFTPFSESEMSRLYNETKGLVGETFECLKLESRSLASTMQNSK